MIRKTARRIAIGLAFIALGLGAVLSACGAVVVVIMTVVGMFAGAVDAFKNGVIGFLLVLALAWGVALGLVLLVKYVRTTGDYPGLAGTIAGLLALMVGGVFFVGWALGHWHLPKEAHAAPMVPIDSISCRSEGRQSVVDVAMGAGREGAYQLEVDLFDFSPPTFIDRREKVIALGKPARETVIYRQAELESLCAAKLPPAHAVVESLDVYVILRWLKSGGAVPTGESSTGKGKLRVHLSDSASHAHDGDNRSFVGLSSGTPCESFHKRTLTCVESL